LKTAHFQSEKTEILFQKSIGEKCRLALFDLSLKFVAKLQLILQQVLQPIPQSLLLRLAQ
jgi:hypothetical protein